MGNSVNDMTVGSPTRDILRFALPLIAGYILQQLYMVIDAAIVGTHIMLEASAQGLGNVWVGSFDPAQIKAEFPETEGYDVVCLFPVGIADAAPGPKHNERQLPADFSSEI